MYFQINKLIELAQLTNGVRMKSLFKYIFICTIFIQPALSLPINNSRLIRNSPKEVIDQVWQIIFRDYMDSTGKYDENDWRKLRKKILAYKYDDTSQSYDAIRGMLSSLDDPYTRFLTPKEFNQMRIDTSGELTGVGIQISIDESSKNILVVSPVEEAPAYKAGILSNDLILSVDGTQTKGLSIDKVVSLIRGRIGSEVTLGILRNNKIINVTLIREKIEIKSVVSKLNKSSSKFLIGYIRLKQFSANASKEMRYAIRSLESNGSDAYVLDLRNNPGGLLESSIDISRQFLDTGIIVRTKTKNAITDIRRARGNALTSKPLAILINEGSASASEIVSGAIKDNARGILVGKKTFGKGLVQSVRPLVDGSGLTVTVAKYLTPNGTDIHQSGIRPDIEISANIKNRKEFTNSDFGSKRDNQYLTAEKELLKILSIRDTKSTFIPSSTNFINALN